LLGGGKSTSRKLPLLIFRDEAGTVGAQRQHMLEPLPQVQIMPLIEGDSEPDVAVAWGAYKRLSSGGHVERGAVLPAFVA